MLGTYQILVRNLPDNRNLSYRFNVSINENPLHGARNYVSLATKRNFIACQVGSDKFSKREKRRNRENGNQGGFSFERGKLINR